METLTEWNHSSNNFVEECRRQYKRLLDTKRRLQVTCNNNYNFQSNDSRDELQQHWDACEHKYVTLQPAEPTFE